MTAGNLFSARLGDAAAYKAALSGVRATPDIASRLRALDQPIPDIDSAYLRTLTPGTLAHSPHVPAHRFAPVSQPSMGWRGVEAQAATASQESQAPAP